MHWETNHKHITKLQIKSDRHKMLEKTNGHSSVTTPGPRLQRVWFTRCGVTKTVDRYVS